MPQAIQALHAAVAEHQDPASKQALAQALQALLKVQSQDMNPPDQQGGGGQAQGPSQPQGAGPAQSIIQALQGGN